MGRRKKEPSQNVCSGRPATTPEAREQQMIALAVDLAEKQLRDGTASTQVITHYLKLASSREALEKDYLAKRTELVDAKIKDIEANKHSEELYANALAAMREYSGGTYEEHY